MFIFVQKQSIEWAINVETITAYNVCQIGK